MSKSLAHLFDYDAIIINKAEAIIDRFLEILNIPELNQDTIRDKLVNFVSVKMLLMLVSKLPTDIRDEIKIELQNVNTEVLLKIKKHFSEDELIANFNMAFKVVIEEKFEILKPQLTNNQLLECENLFRLIGKF